VHDHEWVTEAHAVDITAFQLPLENGPLLDTNTDFELVGGDVLQTEITEEWLTILG